MCLDKTTKRYKEPKSGIGYQIISRADIGDRVGYTSRLYYSQDKYLPNRFYTAKETLIFDWECRFQYMSGFHIFLNKKDVIENYQIVLEYSVYTKPVIIKVQYTGGHTRGYQWGYPIIVAKRRKIIGEVND